MAFETDPGAGNAADAIHVYDSNPVTENFEFRNIHITGSDRDAIHVESGPEDVRFYGPKTSGGGDIDRNHVWVDCRDCQIYSGDIRGKVVTGDNSSRNLIEAHEAPVIEIGGGTYNHVCAKKVNGVDLTFLSGSSGNIVEVLRFGSTANNGGGGNSAWEWYSQTSVV